MSQMADLDLFYTFRTAIFIGVAVYSGISLASTAWFLVAYLRSDDPRMRFVRRYVTYQLASVRLTPLAGELFQMVLLLAALGSIWWAHWSLDL